MVALEDFCKQLPKIELHAHLNGSLSEDTLKVLGVPEELLSGYQIINNTTENTPQKLNECFKLFKVAHSATTTPESVYTATKHVIEEFHKDNVFYLELRTTPREEQNMSKKQYIEAVVKAIQDNKTPLIVKLILSIDRTHDQQVSEMALDLILEMFGLYPDIIKGVDLCGNPNQGTFNEPLFIKARRNGLKVTLHCAEVKNDDEVLKMLKFQPDRIGHGTCIHPDYGGSDEIWKLYSAQKIPIECCLTSNVMCGTSPSYENHHVKEWVKHELPICFNTDDKGVFNTSLSEEYCHIAENLNLSRVSLVKFVFNAIEASFTTAEEQVQLATTFSKWAEENLDLFYN